MNVFKVKTPVCLEVRTAVLSHYSRDMQKNSFKKFNVYELGRSRVKLCEFRGVILKDLITYQRVQQVHIQYSFQHRKRQIIQNF